MKGLSAGASPGWLAMRVADVEFALPIEAVGEVVPTPAVAPVPLLPAWVAGIVSVRNAIVSVVDPGMRLFGKPALRDGRLVLTVADDAGERIGLLVDTTTGLLDRRDTTLEALASPSGGLPARFTKSSVTRGSGGRMPVLDLAALLDPDIDGG